jgi:hypothetical protein
MLYNASERLGYLFGGHAMQTATNPRAERRDRYFGWAVVALWALSYLGARVVLDRDIDLPTWAKVTAALVPIVPTILFLWCISSVIRGMDELHRRVHLEALAVAFPLAILLLMTLGLLQLAIELPEEDWSYRHVWAFLPGFYFLGLVIAWRRYK